MAADVARAKKWCHVATYEIVMCHTRVFVHASECVCGRVCACVYVIKDKKPVKDFC